jgi:hypothetical protein
MKTFKIGNVYCRKGFHYKVCGYDSFDDTYDVVGVCSDCGELFTYYARAYRMALTQQPRRCKEHRRQGVRTDPWPGADKILSYMTATQAMVIASKRKG